MGRKFAAYEFTAVAPEGSSMKDCRKLARELTESAMRMGSDITFTEIEETIGRGITIRGVKSVSALMSMDPRKQIWVQEPLPCLQDIPSIMEGYDGWEWRLHCLPKGSGFTDPEKAAYRVRVVEAMRRMGALEVDIGIIKEETILNNMRMCREPKEVAEALLA